MQSNFICHKTGPGSPKINLIIMIKMVCYLVWFTIKTGTGSINTQTVSPGVNGDVYTDIHEVELD